MACWVRLDYFWEARVVGVTPSPRPRHLIVAGFSPEKIRSASGGERRKIVLIATELAEATDESTPNLLV